MKCFGLTDIGLIRDKNQDSFFYTYNKHNEFLAVVCDGIGGGKAGDVASNMAVDILKQLFLERPLINDDATNKQWVLDAVKKANDEIYMNSLTSRARHGMGTTIVSVLITNQSTYVFHMGDSRLYALYDNEIICLTEDHNLASDLIKNGDLDEKEAFTHPKGKALTNALGIWSKYKVEMNKIRNDYKSLLLCSDGLYSFVSEDVMLDILTSSADIEEKVNTFIEISNKQGGFDNITGVLIEKGEF